jgi:hypothetical protein
MFCLLGTCVRAQVQIPPDRDEPTDSTFVPAEPPLSLARFVMHYLSLKWTDEQWEQLAGREIELLYVIDDIGEPFLEGVRGTEDAIIIDSLRAATSRLPYFTPATEAGQRTESLFSARINFPAYQPAEGDEELTVLVIPAPVDRDELASKYERNRNAIFLDFNATFVDHLGRLDTYLKPGGGLDMHIGGRWSDRWGAALSVGMEFHGRRQPFPDDPYPNREDQSSTDISFGGLLDRVLTTTDRGLLSLRGELAYGQLNAANRLESGGSEEGWVAYRGLHTGVHLSYSIRIGRYTPNVSYSREETTARYSALNIVGGLRYRYYGDREGTGAFYFLGLGYRLGRDDFRRR